MLQIIDVRQLDVFRRTWSIDASVSALEQAGDKCRAWWTVRSRGPNWQVEAVHEALLWDDIVRADFKRPLAVRLLKAAFAYCDLIVTGTMFRYIHANQRYAIFFLFPIFSVVLFAVAGWIVARLAIGFLGLDGVAAAALGVPVGLAVFLLLLRWPGRRWRVEQLLDDWLELFAEALLARTRDTALDEIVIVGHGLGAMLVLDIIVRALARDADFGRRGPAVCVLTIGATIPKFALHPRANPIRRRIAEVAAEPSIAWTEYQSRADTISFYKFDPVSLRRIADDRLDSKPVIRRVQIHDMLLPETFARCRTHVLRLHYRSVMANDRRAPYDYFLMVCGPVAFSDWTISPLGLLDFVAADGACRDSSQPRPVAAQPSV